MSTELSPTPVPVAPPRLRQAEFADYPAIIRLVSAHLQDAQPEADWLAQWHNNPLWPRLGKDWPIGWVLETSAGEIVGVFLNVPSLYHFQGQELICGNGRTWVVQPEYRGFALWVVNEYFSQPNVDLFINTTVGKMAVQAIGSFSERVPVGNWETAAYFPTDYREFARRGLEKLHLPRTILLATPLAGLLWLRDTVRSTRLPSAPPGVEITCASNFAGDLDPFWQELLAQNPHRLLSVRDRSALAWHYARPIHRGRLWVYRAERAGRLRAFAVVKRQDLGEGMLRQRLVDFQTLEPDVDHLSGILRVALRRATADGFSILEHLGCDLPEMHSFDQHAPYRRTFESWQYFYQATDPKLQAQLKAPEVWAPTAYDGDASFE